MSSIIEPKQLFTFTHTHKWIYTRSYNLLHIHTHTHTHTNSLSHTYTHVHTRAHTHIHTHSPILHRRRADDIGLSFLDTLEYFSHLTTPIITRLLACTTVATGTSPCIRSIPLCAVAPPMVWPGHQVTL